MGETAVDPPDRSDLSRAITLYFGHGTEIHPNPDFARVVAGLGEARTEAVRQDVEDAVTTLYSVTPAWHRLSMIAGTEEAVGRVRLRYPQLDDAACEALFWDFTWNFK